MVCKKIKTGNLWFESVQGVLYGIGSCNSTILIVQGELKLRHYKKLIKFHPKTGSNMRKLQKALVRVVAPPNFG